MMNESEHLYEFSSAFRGESYEWHPQAPPEARHWHALLVHCLRHQLSEVVIESAAGRRWTVAWSPKSRNQVRGGSLRVEEVPSRPRESPDQPAAELEEALPGLRLALTGLIHDDPRKLTREQWLEVINPESPTAKFFAAIELAIPSFAVWAEEPDVGRTLGQLGPIDLVVLVDTSPSPTVAGELLIDWFDGRGWLLARLGPPEASAVELLGPALRAQTLTSLAELAQFDDRPVTGWEDVERVLSVFADVAARWANARPAWQARIDPTIRVPTLDVRTGVVEIPGTGDRRARSLSARLSGDTPVAKPPPLLDSSWFDKTHAAVALVAMLLGMVLGFWCGYLWATKLVFF